MGSDEAESAILVVLKDAGDELSLPSLVNLLQQKGIQNIADIKAAVWNLIAKHRITMTSMRGLHEKKP